VATDFDLVQSMLAGDEAAFERFFDASYPLLYRFALVRLGFDRDAAGDVAQAAICKAIVKLRTFLGEAALLTWLCTFCRHELYAFHRRNPARVEGELAEDDPEIRAALESLRASTSQDVEAWLDHDKAASIVQRVLDHLPPHYADALEWKYIDEISVQEIGVRLGLGPKAAESLLTRARRAFRDAFQTMAPAWPVHPDEGSRP
jgi:RNA polymerase sigma-70 factor (ECF subfamily)